MLAAQLPSWQEKCSDITKVPDTVNTMIEELSPTPEQSPVVQRYDGVSVYLQRHIGTSCHDLYSLI